MRLSENVHQLLMKLSSGVSNLIIFKMEWHLSLKKLVTYKVR